MSIPVIDLVVIVAYLVGVTAVGLLSVRHRELTGEVYFLAGRALPWGIVGAALFSSNISTIHLVGLAEAGYKHGLVIGNFEWMATLTLILLALVLAPSTSAPASPPCPSSWSGATARRCAASWPGWRLPPPS